MKTLRGSGAVIGLSLVSNAIERLGAAMKTTAEQMAAGQKNWADLMLEFTYGIPLIGGAVKGLSDMADALDYAITGRKTDAMIAEEGRQSSAISDTIEQERRKLALLGAGNDLERNRLQIQNDYLDQMRDLDEQSGGGMANPRGYRIAQGMIEQERYMREVNLYYDELDAQYEHGKAVRLESLQLEKKARNENADAYKKEVSDRFDKLNAEYERLKNRQLEDLRTEQKMRLEGIEEANRKEQQGIEKARALRDAQRKEAESVRQLAMSRNQREQQEWNRLHAMVKRGDLTRAEAGAAWVKAKGTSDAESLTRREAEFTARAFAAGAMTQGEYRRRTVKGYSPAGLLEAGSEADWRARHGQERTEYRMLTIQQAALQFLKIISQNTQKQPTKELSFA
jgi:hypothetical protein